jgi:hypothetical protein
VKTIVTKVDTGIYRNYCVLLAELIPHLDWRHAGLGMLQAYVREGEENELRAHIWHPELRREGIEESGLFHDHRFDLTSYVLVGMIEQVEHRLTPNANGAWGLNRVLHARAAAEQNLLGPERLTSYHADPVQLPERCNIASETVRVYEREAYFFPKREFHGTYFDSALAVTLVEKSRQDATPAQILAPIDKPIVHAFEKPLPQSAWQHILDQAAVALRARW